MTDSREDASPTSEIRRARVAALAAQWKRGQVPTPGEAPPLYSDADRTARYYFDHDVAGGLNGQADWARLRLTQMKCSRCPAGVVGAIFECRHPDGSNHDLAEIQRVGFGPASQLVEPIRIMLAAEPPSAPVIIDCEMVSHGQHLTTVGALRMYAADGRRRLGRKHRRHAGRSAVQELLFEQR